MRKLKGEMTGILFIYLIVINVIAFVTYGADKRRAMRLRDRLWVRSRVH